MESQKPILIERIYFFDHIRYLMVILVIVLHSSCAYSRLTNWWWVNDVNAEFFDYLSIFLGLFLMPVLFFVAGYFALPSIQPKGCLEFIRVKLRRLGIPLILGLFLAGPYFIYIRTKQFGNLADYWDKFVLNIESAVTFRTGLILSVNQFQHHYFWFISLLFLFFVVFALLWKAGLMFAPTTRQASKKSILKAFLISGLLASSIAMIIHGILMKNGILWDPWFIIASLIQFQPTAIAMYAIYFILGVFACSRNWFKDGVVPGHYLFWACMSFVLFFTFIELRDAVIQGFIADSKVQIHIGAAFVLIRHFAVFTFLLTFISFSSKHWSRPSRLNDAFAASSYNIYLVHLIFVVTIQFFLIRWFFGFIYLKFFLVVLGSIFLSFGVSHFCIRPYPKRSVAGIIFLAGFLFITLRP